MKNLLQKIQVWHLLFFMIIPITGFIFSLGATNQTIASLSKNVEENRKKNERINIIETKVDLTKDQVDKVNNTLNQLRKEILEIYKNR